MSPYIFFCVCEHASPNHNVVYCTGIPKPLPIVIHHTQPMKPHHIFISLVVRSNLCIEIPHNQVDVFIP